MIYAMVWAIWYQYHDTSVDLALALINLNLLDMKKVVGLNIMETRKWVYYKRGGALQDLHN